MGIKQELRRRLQSALHREADSLRRIQNLGLQGAARVACLRLGVSPSSTLGQWTPWQREVFRALQARMCQPDADDLPTPTSIDAFARSLAYVQRMPPDTRHEMGYLLSLWEAGPSILGPNRRLGRFTRLTPTEQDLYLSLWESSSIPAQRAAFRALKAVCAMGYWSHPLTWRAIDYTIAGNPGVPEALRQHFKPLEKEQV